MLKNHLAQAENHVSMGDEIIARQRRLIFRLERDGHDSTEARGLLALFEDVQKMHEADRDRLLKEFQESPAPGLNTLSNL